MQFIFFQTSIIQKKSADTNVPSLSLQKKQGFAEIDGAVLVCACWCSVAMKLWEF